MGESEPIISARNLIILEENKNKAIERENYRLKRSIVIRNITVSCVPNIKVPTREQMAGFQFQAKFGDLIFKAKEDAKEKLGGEDA